MGGGGGESVIPGDQGREQGRMRERFTKGHEDIFGVTDIFIIVVVLWVYTYAKLIRLYTICS